MDVHHARAFLAVAEELHFGRAALRLRVAQPALSRLIKALERDLGATLFERSTRHVALTPAGTALVEVARDLVAVSERARETVRGAVTGEIGVVRLGFAGASINRSVARLAREVRARCPGVRLELQSSQFSPQGLERVISGDLDLCVGRWDYLPAEVRSYLVGREQLLVALPRAHRLASASSVAMADLAEEEWITLPGGSMSALTNRLQSLARTAGFVPRVREHAPDSWTQTLLVDAGVGIALTLDSVRDNVGADGVAWLPLEPAAAPLDVRLIWREHDDNRAVERVTRIAAAIFPARPAAG
ncbi:LysR family transcriptional regulator [Micrococcus endophyticus]|uniref:LysR family transcriptional regulator n=1 Tax=Micrococcus endophyticus TaxID=455343 RepID=UPI0034CD063B